MWMETVRIELAHDRLLQQQEKEDKGLPVRDAQADFSVTVWDRVPQRRSRHAAPGQVCTTYFLK